MVELQDMEVVLEVQLMHRAPNMAVSRDWSLQHVEVAHEGSGRTFYFMAGEWVGWGGFYGGDRTFCMRARTSAALIIGLWTADKRPSLLPPPSTLPQAPARAGSPSFCSSS